MRAVILPVLLAIVFPCLAHGDDLIPGVVSFDPPAFLYVSTYGRASDNIFSGVGELREYHAGDNDIRTGQRDLFINVKEVGFFIGPGKVVTYQKLNDKGLRAWMQNALNPNRNGTNSIKVADAIVGGQPSLTASYKVAQPNWHKKPGALFSFEVYWVRIHPNRVLEIELVADTPEHMDTLRPCLNKFRIKRKDG
jgi:hypothetical protein